MRRAVPLALLLALGGCAEVWTRPGTSEAESERAFAACERHSVRAVPPAYERRLVSAERVERNRTCRQRNGREECRTEETRHPARYETVDLNEGERRRWRNACMASQGFTFAGLRPLRLSPPDETPPAPPVPARPILGPGAMPVPFSRMTPGTGAAVAFPPGAGAPLVQGLKPSPLGAS